MSHKTPTSPAPLEPFYPKAIDLMLQDKVTFLQALSILGIKTTPEEAADHSRRKSFRDLFEQMTRFFYESKSGTTSHSKSILTGKMLDIAQRLHDGGRLKESADVLAQIAKIEGWTGADTTISFYQQMSGADLARAISEIRERRVSETVN